MAFTFGFVLLGFISPMVNNRIINFFNFFSFVSILLNVVQIFVYYALALHFEIKSKTITIAQEKEDDEKTRALLLRLDKFLSQEEREAEVERARQVSNVLAKRNKKK